MDFENDPVGHAIFDFIQTKSNSTITIYSDLCDDDVIPVPYLFRPYKLMPDIEKTALSLCSGKILDVGAGAGCHSIILREKGFDVTSIDTSKGAVDAMKRIGLKAKKTSIFDLPDSEFDTILILMNGLGLAKNMDQLNQFLLRLKKLLSPKGKIYCDSTDLCYLYQEEDGSMLIDLNAKYYGEIKFNMKYKSTESGWFEWLFIDFENLSEHANESGLQCTLIEENDNHFLVCLEHN